MYKIVLLQQYVLLCKRILSEFILRENIDTYIQLLSG